MRISNKNQVPQEIERNCEKRNVLFLCNTKPFYVSIVLF